MVRVSQGAPGQGCFCRTTGAGAGGAEVFPRVCWAKLGLLWQDFWNWSGHELGTCWDGLGRPARVPGALQTAASALGLRASEFV